MGKKAKLGIGIATLLIASSVVTTALAGGDTNVGSIDDPLVTKSYVDEQVQLKVEEILNQYKEQNGNQLAPIIVEKLGTGDILVGKEGTEIIVRSGKVQAFGDGSNGIPDVTSGVDIKIGQAISLNHQLIIPRADGRGIKVVSGPSYVMLRGDYEIINH